MGGDMRYKIGQNAYIKLVLQALNHKASAVNSLLLGRLSVFCVFCRESRHFSVLSLLLWLIMRDIIFLLDRESPSSTESLRHNLHSVRSVVGNAVCGADSELIDSLSSLEIVASYSVGLDKIDLGSVRREGSGLRIPPMCLRTTSLTWQLGLLWRR